VIGCGYLFGILCGHGISVVIVLMKSAHSRLGTTDYISALRREPPVDNRKIPLPITSRHVAPTQQLPCRWGHDARVFRSILDHGLHFFRLDFDPDDISHT